MGARNCWSYTWNLKKGNLAFLPKKRSFEILFIGQSDLMWGEGACSVGVINVSAMAHEVSINHRQYFYSVELPPQKMDTENPKVLELEQGLDKPQLNIEVSHSSQSSLRRLGGMMAIF